MSGRSHRMRLSVALSIGVTVLACVWIGHVPAVSDGLAYLGPAAFAFVLLWLGRYPGERSILALSRRRNRRRPSGAQSSRCPLRERRMPRGGRLLATALAGRAPPPLSS
jgi:hypothetical protein